MGLMVLEGAQDDQARPAGKSNVDCVVTKKETQETLKHLLLLLIAAVDHTSFRHSARSLVSLRRVPLAESDVILGVVRARSVHKVGNGHNCDWATA
jgi:hypothetical protein